MPYDDEFAHYKPLKRIAESEMVKSLLKRARTEIDTANVLTLSPLTPDTLNPSSWLPDLVLAVDGSMAEVPVKNGYPLAAVGYVTVASVLLDVAKMIQLDSQRPVDPKEFRTIENAEAVDSALPGCNVVVDNERNAKDSFRRALYELFQSKRMAENSENILGTYEALLKHKPPDEQKCPYEEDCLYPDKSFQRGMGEYTCGCSHARSLFSTDSLRIHEFMNPEGSNQSMLTETMTSLERIWIIHILRTLEKENLLPILKRMAIVLDGPLAVFGAPAWLSTAIRTELQRLNKVARAALADDTFNILWVGIEKSGNFVDHFLQLDLGPNGETDHLPKQSVMLLTDPYIKQRIIFSKSPAQYGRNTYFGRKAFYKTSSGSLIVFQTPFLNNNDDDLQTAKPEQFPRLTDAMNLLDKLVSARYRNSVTPLISAHAEAAIPFNLGKNVLEKLAKQLMSEAKKKV
jgi:hypothetical protein